jgi:hypothetical protein
VDLLYLDGLLELQLRESGYHFVGGGLLFADCVGLHAWLDSVHGDSLSLSLGGCAWNIVHGACGLHGRICSVHELRHSNPPADERTTLADFLSGI